MSSIIGIDPGFSGAIAVINGETKEILALLDMLIIKVGKGKKKKNHLDEIGIRDILKNNADHVFIEKCQAMPASVKGVRQGIASTANYMTGYGIIRGICVGLGIPYTLIHPKTWKKAMMPDMGRDKGASIIRVKQLYPSIDLPRKKDHGKADSILIARYGARMV